MWGAGLGTLTTWEGAIDPCEERARITHIQHHNRTGGYAPCSIVPCGFRVHSTKHRRALTPTHAPLSRRSQTCDALSFQRLTRALPHTNWADIRMVCDPASRPLGTPCYYNFSAIHRYWNRPDVQVDGGLRGTECRL